MGTFKTTKTITAPTTLITGIVNEIEQTFLSEGYNVDKQSLSIGGFDMSLAKGGIFKAVLGLKSALKVKICPDNGNITIEAGVGIFGQQFIPALVTWYIAWPVLLTQIWGMVKQSKLDERVINIAEVYVAKHVGENFCCNSSTTRRFCTKCGAENTSDAKFCSKCGKEL